MRKLLRQYCSKDGMSSDEHADMLAEFQHDPPRAGPTAAAVLPLLSAFNVSSDGQRRPRADHLDFLAGVASSAPASQLLPAALHGIAEQLSTPGGITSAAQQLDLARMAPSLHALLKPHLGRRQLPEDMRACVAMLLQVCILDHSISKIALSNAFAVSKLFTGVATMRRLLHLCPCSLTQVSQRCSVPCTLPTVRRRTRINLANVAQPAADPVDANVDQAATQPAAGGPPPVQSAQAVSAAPAGDVAAAGVAPSTTPALAGVSSTAANAAPAATAATAAMAAATAAPATENVAGAAAASPRTPAMWSEDEAMCQTGEYGRLSGGAEWRPSPLGGSDVQRLLRNYAADSVSFGTRQSCTKHKSSHCNLLPGCMVFWCHKCGVCRHFTVMQRAESPFYLFHPLYTRCVVAPTVLCFDNACNGHAFNLNREPEFFKFTRMYVDESHFRGHSNCAPDYNTGWSTRMCIQVLCQVQVVHVSRKPLHAARSTHAAQQ